MLTPLIIPSKAVPGVLSLVLGLSVQGDVETLKRTQEGGLPRWSGVLMHTVYREKLSALA